MVTGRTSLTLKSIFSLYQDKTSTYKTQVCFMWSQCLTEMWKVIPLIIAWSLKYWGIDLSENHKIFHREMNEAIENEEKCLFMGPKLQYCSNINFPHLIYIHSIQSLSKSQPVSLVESDQLILKFIENLNDLVWPKHVWNKEPSLRASCT